MSRVFRSVLILALVAVVGAGCASSGDGEGRLPDVDSPGLPDVVTPGDTTGEPEPEKCQVDEDCRTAFPLAGECRVGVCGDNGYCVLSERDDGAPCGSEEHCLTGMTCLDGECVGGEPLECEPSNECVTAECVAGEGCVETPTEEGTPCEDGLFCTVEMVCRDGRCEGEPRVCDDGDPCTAGACDEALGECVFTPLVCDDGDPCTESVCDPATGDCLHEPIECDDGDLCTTGSCDPADGECEYAPVVCDDGDLCTVSVCDPATGDCLHEPVACLEGDPCTVGACDPESGDCEYEPRECDDGDPCTVSACDPALDECVHEPIVCDEAAVCEVGACDPDLGECVYGPLVCDDGDLCTEGECDPATGECVFEDVVCVDDDPCTVGACDPATGECEYEPVMCNDGDPCTVGICDPATGDCLFEDLECPDPDPCTVSFCDPITGGCVDEPRVCDDGDICTKSDCDVDRGGCVHDPVVCDEWPECAGGECDPITGECVYDLSNCPEICDDGIDNNGNGLTDCDDPQCSAAVKVPGGCTDWNDLFLVVRLDPEEIRQTCVLDSACFDDAYCVASCVENNTDLSSGLSSDCATCVGGLAACAYDKCLDACDDLASLECDACLEEQGCIEDYEDCFGELLCDFEYPCDDGIDNDGNGLTDCDDPACFQDPVCILPYSCESPGEILDYGTVTGDTDDLGGMHHGSCRANSGVEAVWRFEAAESGVVCANTFDSDYDTVLYVRADDCYGGQELACNVDMWGIQSQVQFEVVAGRAYYLFVDARTRAEGGDYRLLLRPGSCLDVPVEICDDGIDNTYNGLTDCDDPSCFDHPECAPPGDICDHDEDCVPDEPCMVGVCDPGTLTCRYEPLDCPAGEVPCTVGEGTCDEASGECVYDPLECPAGEVPCTVGEGTCDEASGECVYDPLECPEGEPGTVGVCDPETGECVYHPVEETPGTCDSPTPRVGAGRVWGLIVDDEGELIADDCLGGVPGGYGGEAVFLYQAEHTGEVCIDTFGSEVDTVLYVREQCESGPELACNFDADSFMGTWSEVEIVVEEGRDYYVVVDTFTQGETGAFALNIVIGPCGMKLCDDGIDNDGDGLTDCADPDCFWEDVCDGACTARAELPCNGTFEGTTVGRPPLMHDYSCPGSWYSTGPEMVYSFVPEAAGALSVELSVSGASPDLSLFLLKDHCDQNACVDFHTSAITRAVAEGEQYFVVVDGYDGDAGQFSIAVQCPQALDCDPDAYEPDDTELDATELSFPSTGPRAHSLCPAGDRDMWVFELEEQMHFVVWAGNESNGELEMWLYQFGTLPPSGHYIDSNEADLMGAAVSKALTLPAGIYYVAVAEKYGAVVESYEFEAYVF